METLTFTCKIITPMFLAGADGKTPELRAASIKGALRFWWRAKQREPDHKILKAKEDAIFGGVGSGKEGNAQRSKVVLQVIPVNGCNADEGITKGLPNHMVKTRHKGIIGTINLLEYLAYGVTGRGITERPYFDSGAKFRLNLRFHPALSTDAKKEVVTALLLLSRYSGIGSKSRNGFGSISVGYEGSIDWCSELFRKDSFYLAQGSRVDYTAFSKDTKLYETKLHPTWDAALAEVGEAYRGAYPAVGSMKGTKGRLGLDILHEGHQRKFIAMPLQRVRFESNDVHERRPKSLFLGVSQVDKQYKGHILYLPDTYQHNGTSQQTRHDKAYAELMKNFSSLTLVSL